MKTTVLIPVLAFCYTLAHAQSVVGTWQLTDEKTCMQSELNESATETELLKDMKSSANAVARTIRFDKKGRGEEGIFRKGAKKGSGMEKFNYRVDGGQIAFLDVKSGIMTEQWVIEELTSSTLRIHNAKRDCEVKTLSRIK